MLAVACRLRLLMTNLIETCLKVQTTVEKQNNRDFQVRSRVYLFPTASCFPRSSISPPSPCTGTSAGAPRRPHRRINARGCCRTRHPEPRGPSGSNRTSPPSRRSSPLPPPPPPPPPPHAAASAPPPPPHAGTSSSSSPR
jgi:hypothetical protein